MASVYVARDERLDREVAFKVMRPDLATDPEFVKRFRAEAQSAARLRSNHAVAVYDQGRDHDIVFLAMELVPGTTLRGRLDEVGALRPREALDVMDAILAALAEAHALGLVHRDVKPENVLIRDDDTVKVADFGLARAVTTRTSTGLGRGLLGTFAYVSPEQVSAGTADARSDVYAAGLVLFEMLTGRQAFAGDSPIHVAFRHVTEEVVPPSTLDAGLSDTLDECVLAATAIDPDERPADADRYRTLLRGLGSQLTDAELDRESPARHAPKSAVPPPAHTERMGADLLNNRTRMLPRPELPPAPPERRAQATGATSTSARDSAAGARKRRHGCGITAVALTALLMATLAWFFLAGPGAARELPAVAGQPAGEATAHLDASGFDTTVSGEFSETVPEGRVIRTEPGPGQVRAVLPVGVVVSSGPERYAVPDVARLDIDTATTRIEDANLTVSGTQEGWSEQIPAGSVARTDPPAGTALPPGGGVTLVISQGPEPIALEDWTGRPADQARAALEQAGLTVTITGEEHSTEVERGGVVSQEPSGTTLHRGDTVSLVVSLGPRMVEVPQIQGMRENEAVAALEEAGFDVRVERIVGGVFGTARSTDPEAGSSAPHGSTVTLYVV